LVRNLLVGRAVCERFGARPSRVGYLPDSFGHPTQLPQILAGFGIESFLFSRGVGDEVGDVGRIFRWTAPDGSAVTAFNLPGHYDSAVHLRSGDDLADRARRLVERYGLRDVVLCNGSDHQPVQPELPRFVARARRLLGRRGARRHARALREGRADGRCAGAQGPGRPRRRRERAKLVAHAAEPAAVATAPPCQARAPTRAPPRAWARGPERRRGTPR